MKFSVLSKYITQEFVKYKQSLPFIIVSIGSIGAKNAVFAENQQLKAVLRVKFDDTDSKLGAITPETAQEMVDFVNAWKDKVNHIIVHCDAGVSRSAGVCAALMLWLNGDDSPIFDDPFYKPNMRCYRTILNAICEGEQYEKNKSSPA